MIDRAPPAGIRIRQEAPGDEPAIRAVTDAAFAPSTEEGRIVDALRADRDAWLPALSLVAVGPGGAIVGHVVTSRGTLHADDGTTRSILALGPISVVPDRHGQGVGGGLMRASIARATADGWPAIVLLGHAGYYPRFGFRPARGLGIEPPRPWSDAHWLALRLPAWTPDLRGTMRYPSVFGID